MKRTKDEKSEHDYDDGATGEDDKGIPIFIAEFAGFDADLFLHRRFLSTT